MKFKDWLEANNKTIEDVAYKIKASRAAVFYWQQGKFKPSKPFMEKLFKLTKGQVTKEDFNGLHNA